MGLATTLVCLVWALVSRALNMPGPAQHLPSVLRTGVDEATAKDVAERLRVNANRGLAVARRVAVGEELGLSLRALAALYGLGTLGRIATPLGLLFAALVALFSLPKLYELRKDDVDAGLSTAHSYAERHLTTAKARVEEVVSRLTPRKAPPPAPVTKDE